MKTSNETISFIFHAKDLSKKEYLNDIMFYVKHIKQHKFHETKTLKTTSMKVAFATTNNRKPMNEIELVDFFNEENFITFFEGYPEETIFTLTINYDESL